MLHIILLILKIIGIVLLVLIGLLLLILLTILLVPVRYRATVSHGQAFVAVGRISWLLHILGARVTYLEGKLHIRVRVLWITLYDNLMPRKSEVKEPKVKKDKHTAINKKKMVKTKSKHKVNHKFPKTDESRISQESTLKVEIEQQIVKDEKKERNYDTPNASSAVKESTPVKVISTETYDNAEKEEKKKSIFKKVIEKVINFKNKIIAFFEVIKSKIKKLLDTFSNIKQKIHLITDFIKDEYNKEGFKITYASFKKLLKHVLPKKLKSRIVFGTGDPCSTGQALGVLSILYSFYGDKVVIIPDFEKKRLEGEHFAKGRIRLATVLIIVIKLILDKRIKKLRSNFEILKEAL
jgi:hypothetical protein